MPKSRFKTTATGLILVCGFLWIRATGKSLPAIIQDEVRAQVDGIRDHDGFPGATIAFSLPDGVLGEAAVGYADLEHHRKMRPQDRMLAGSVGKTFVSATLLQLVDSGDIRLDEKVEAKLGDKPWFDRIPNAHDLTVRMLLNHTSGIPDHVEMQAFADAVRKDPWHVWKPEELLAFIFNKPPLFPAGKGWSYADTNYILVGMIIERITHDTLYAEIEKRFLGPLHLSSTEPSDHADLKGLVPAYADLTLSYGQPRKMAEHEHYDFNPQFEWAGGGYISNSADLARWVKVLYQGRLFRPETFRELIKGVDTPRGYKYGLGVYIRQTALGMAYGHGGQIPGYYTITAYYPDKNLSVAMQFNTDDSKLFKETVPSYIYLPRMIDEVAQTISNQEGVGRKENTRHK
jgi:D-alanyl-D-alanine carboxypeptidase